MMKMSNGPGGGQAISQQQRTLLDGHAARAGSPGDSTDRESRRAVMEAVSSGFQRGMASSFSVALMRFPAGRRHRVGPI